ncbi:MAG: ParB/RepB/Spo0J family partition protein [Moraxellaceae bacterium]|jgi:ParB family chromosome partitioning protein|nr:ParB/RepB/Spo0J family partition protein [Pseudomonadales bacterium]MCP5177616.1 ParB/RepB/Spo0J family partition protein [Moraxellaceae bacterium]
MSKKGFFANRKTSQAAQTNLGSPESRFDLEEFEREVVAEARENNKIAHIAKEQIDPDPNQPRSEFDQEAMDELRISIEQNGLIQPIVVRQIGERYQIIAGERRWRACLMIASISAIDAVVRNDVDPLTILLLQIAENNHRQSMTPMDIARAYQRVKEFSGNSQKKAAIRLGVSESQISITLGLIKSPELIQNLAMSGKIRDITTLNIVNRLYEQDVIAAKKVVDDILKGRIDAGSVRKQVNSLLQKSKGKIEHAQFVKHHIKADTIDLIQEGKTIIVRLKSKKASYDIELPIGVNELNKLLTALQEKPTNE